MLLGVLPDSNRKNECVSAVSLSAGRRSHRWTSATEASRSAEVAAFHLRVVLVAAESSELVGEREHEVARQRVILHIAYVVGGYAAADALSLSQNVEYLHRERCRLVG